MTSTSDTVQWKRLGKGNLLLKSGSRIVSIAIGIAALVAFFYFKENIVVRVTGFAIENDFPVTLPVLEKAGYTIVVLYFLGEILVWLWDILLHFRLRYRLDEDAVVKQGGIYKTYSHTIPQSRVQGVEVKANPFQRLVGVSDVTITTAGVHSPNMTIHNLATAEAVAIQNQLGVDHD